MTKQESNLDTFLRELEALCARLKIEIDGCGCCGSPFLSDSGGAILGEDLSVSAPDWVAKLQ